MYFMVGGNEALLDDSIGMARKAIEQGVPAHVQIWRGMPHVFVLQNVLPETPLARREIAAWLTNLREPRPEAAALYRGCVEVCDLAPFTHTLSRVTNDVFLDVPTNRPGVNAG